MRNISLLFVAALLMGTPLAAQAPALTAKQWRDDLRTVAQDIRQRHPDPYHATPKARIDAEIAALDRDIPGLARNRIIARMMRIAALVGDGHTRIDPRKDKAFRFASLPLRLYAFDDGLYVRAAAPAQRDLVGWKVETIGGVPAAEAMRRAGELVSADTDSGRLLLAPVYLGMPELLEAIGLSKQTDHATLTLARGKARRTITLAAGEVAAPWPSDTDISLVTPAGWVDARQGPAPLYLADPLDFHRLVQLPQAHALYVQLNWVADLDRESLAAFGKRIRDAARATNPRALVLDLRFNLGGNGDLANAFVSDLIKAEDDDTRLFVLVGRGTFSASQFILNDLDRLSDALFVGEPASSRPSSYGDSFKTILPNSGIAMRTSIYWWQEGQNRDPFTWIDVAAPLSFADYAAGRDPALSAALAYAPPTPLDALLYEAAKAGRTEAAVAAWRAGPANRYAHQALLLPRAAEAILGAGHKPEALAVARAVAAALPEVADSWLVLAYVALENGDKPAAAIAARKALAIDPNQRNARSVLESATAP